MPRMAGASGAVGAVREFWRWWLTARAHFEAAIGHGDWADLPGEMNRRVAAIAPELEWEFCAGRQSAHALVVSAAGNRQLRVLAERWCRAAPAADSTWEYHPSRQADPRALTSRLGLANQELDLAELRFGYEPDDNRRQIDVSVYHPEFERVAERDRDHVAFLALDWLLGEDAVEAWIGVIEATTDGADAADPGNGLRAAVSALADEPPLWTVLGGTGLDGRPITATVQTPLRAVRWPLFDQHIEVVLPYPPVDGRGLPAPADLEALRDFEDRLVAQLDHTATLIAHETSAGRRTLHLYADAATPAIAVAGVMRGEWRYGPAQVTARPDPSWEAVAHLRL
jgi:hypothetical protein